jgi:hypothetical protein
MRFDIVLPMSWSMLCLNFHRVIHKGPLFSAVSLVWLNILCNPSTEEQTPWPLVRDRTIPTERPPLVDEIYCQLLWIEGCRVVGTRIPHGR